MNMKQIWPWITAVLLTAGSGCVTTKPLPEVVVVKPAGTTLSEPSDVNFKRDIAPILTPCVVCHYTGSELTPISFQKRDGLLESHQGRPILVPGDPDKSTMFLVTVLPEYFVEAMPPSGHRLSEDAVWKLYNWIYIGAPWPDGEVLKKQP